MNIKIRQLFTPLQNWTFEYKGDYPLIFTQGKQIIPGQYVDLSEYDMLSAYKDDADLNLILKDNILYYNWHSS